MNTQIQILRETEVLDRQFNVYGTFDEPLFLAKDVSEMKRVQGLFVPLWAL